MPLRPFSDHDRGLFISVDGPSCAGKSTIVQHLAQLLVTAGETVHVTAEPSTGRIGELARELTETVTGHALACLYAAALCAVCGCAWPCERAALAEHTAAAAL